MPRNKRSSQILSCRFITLPGCSLCPSVTLIFYFSVGFFILFFDSSVSSHVIISFLWFLQGSFCLPPLCLFLCLIALANEDGQNLQVCIVSKVSILAQEIYWDIHFNHNILRFFKFKEKCQGGMARICIPVVVAWSMQSVNGLEEEYQ